MEPADAEALWRRNDDPEVVRWMSDTHPSTPHATRARVAPADTRMVLGVETPAEPRLVGVTALTGADPETGRADLDLHLGERDGWGRGLGTEATRLLRTHGFDDMRPPSIDLAVVGENVAAHRVHGKAGLQEIGRARHAFRRAGRRHDMILMDLLDRDLDTPLTRVPA